MSQFTQYLEEVFASFGPIRIRPMFGGHGVFHDGLMIGLVANDELYLKADKQLAKRFAEDGLEQFEYMKAGKTMKMSYFRAPEEIYDDPGLAKQWAVESYAAAVRSKR